MNANSQTIDIIITRLFDAPRSRVWQAWTEPEPFMRWWGPEHFTSPMARMEVRPGGRYLFCMRSPDGQNYYSTGTYREVVPQKRIVYTDSFGDEAGNVVAPTQYGLGPEFPMETQVALTLEEVNGQTRMTLINGGQPPGEMIEMTRAGWNQSFDKLAQSLRG